MSTLFSFPKSYIHNTLLKQNKNNYKKVQKTFAHIKYL